MATDRHPRPLPGDLIQAVNHDNLTGHVLIVTQIRPTFTGAVIRWPDRGQFSGVSEQYHRLKHDQYVIVGACHILPEDLAHARKAAIAHAEQTKPTEEN